MHRTLRRIVAGRETPEGDGMRVRRAFPGEGVGRIDPFLMLDEMGPMTFAAGARAGFPDHPHRGFETVTYMLEGEFEHRDSHGHHGTLRPGDVQWMTAGAGVVHSEMPSSRIRREGGTIHGLQLWINLPKSDKMMTPRYQEFPAQGIPVVAVQGGKIHVVAGEFQGAHAVIDTRTPMQFLRLELQAGHEVELPIPGQHEGFLYVLTGGLEVGGQTVPKGHLGILEPVQESPQNGAPSTSSTVRVKAQANVDAILVSGIPIREPVFQYGPFVMNTRDEIVTAVADFQAGKFGTIPARAN